MSRSLQILIGAKLNTSAALTQLQADLKRISSQLNVSVNINSQGVDQLNKSTQQVQQNVQNMSKSMDSAGQSMSRSTNTAANNVRGLESSTGRIYRSLSEIRKSFTSIGGATATFSKIFDGNRVREYNAQLQRTNGMVEQIGFRRVNYVNEEGRSAVGWEVARRREIDNTERVRQQSRMKLDRQRSQALVSEAKQIERANQMEERRNAKLRERIHLFQRQQALNVLNLQRTHGHGVDQRAMQAYLRDVNSLTASTPNAERAIGRLNMRFKELSASSKQAAASVGHSSMAVSEMMRTALVKFPIWMASATIFYQPIRLGRDLIDTLIDINTYTTILTRVSGGEIDTTRMLRDSIEMAMELGVQLDDLNDQIEGFARQGFRGNELMDMSRASTLMTNVSTLEGEEAMSALTAAIRGFRLETEMAVDVVDKFNEVDNNFSTTTAILTESVQKAAGAANTFGVDLDSLIGHTTAIGQVTRESGRIIGNSLKTIYSRITAFGGSINILEEVGVSTRDMSGDLRNVEDILEDLAGKWDGLSNEMQQQIGLQLAGRFQLSRFLTLMQQWDQAQEATTTAINSTGSAMRENEAYLESMEAKLNQMRTALVSAFLEMGESFANEAILTFAETFTKAFTAVGNFINRFGAVPALFAATTPLILLMNRGIWGFITGAGKATTATGALAVAKTKLTTTQGLLNRGFLASRGYMAAATAGMVAKTVATKALNVAMRVFLTTLRGIMAATGVGVVIMGLGYAADFLMSKFFGARNEADQFNEALERINSTYEQSRSDINNLADEYENLTSTMENRDLSTEEHERYVEIQNRLGELLPHLVMGEDEHGNAILRKSDFVRDEIELLERKLELEREQRALEAMAGMEDNQNDIVDTEAELEGLRQRLELNRENAKQYEEGSKQREEIDRAYREGMVKEGELRSQLHMLEMEQNQMMLDFYGDRQNLMEEDLEYFNRLIEAGDLQLHTIQELAAQVDEYRQIVGDAFTAEEIMAFTEEQREALDAVSEAMGNQNAELDVLEEKLLDAGFSYSVVQEALDAVSESVEILNQKLEVEIFRDLEGAIPVETVGDLNDALEENIPLYEMVDGRMRRVTDESIEQAMAIGDLTDEIDDNTDALFANFDATEALFGMTDSQIDLVYDAIEAYQLLSEAEYLNAEQTAILEEAKAYLAEMFPHLVEGSSMNIDAMIAESEMMAGLGEASVAYANGRLSSEETLTYEAIKASSARIRQMQLEINNLNILRQEMLGMIRELESVAEATGVVHYSGGRALREVVNQTNRQTAQLQESIGQESLSRVGHWQGSALQSNFSPSNRFHPQGGGSPNRSSGSGSGGSGGRSPSSSSGSSSGGRSGAGSSTENSKEEARNQKDILDSLIRQANVKSRMLEIESESLSRSLEKAEHEGSYAKQLEITNKQIENNQKSIDALKKSQKEISSLASQIRRSTSFKNTDSWFDSNNEETVEYIRQYNAASSEQQEEMEAVFNSLQKLKNAWGSNAQEINSLVSEGYKLENQLKSIKNEIEDLRKEAEDHMLSELTENMGEIQSAHVERLKEKFEELNESLRNMLPVEDIFDVEEFSSVVEGLIYDLDRIDGIIRANPVYQSSTSSLRRNISMNKQDIIDMADAVQNMADATSDNKSEMEDMIRAQIEYSNLIKEEIDTVNQAIRARELEQKKIEDAIQNQIDKKREQINQLDEEYKKEDRLKRLRDLERDIEDTRNDRRFSYITEEGEEVLTYNRARVSELESQRDEMLKEFEREDIRKAMEDEVSRLEEKRDKTREIHNQEMEQMRLYRNSLNTIYNGLISNTNEKLSDLESLQNDHISEVEENWDEILKAVEEGTIGYNELMDDFINTALEDMGSFASNLKSQVDEVANQYRRLEKLRENRPSSSASSGGSSNVLGMSDADYKRYLQNKADWDAGRNPERAAKENQQIRDAYNIPSDNFSHSELKKYHTGGIISGGKNKISEIANKLFNASPNEQVVKALKGELMIPADNIRKNFIPNINGLLGSISAGKNSSVVADQSKHYHFKDLTIKADNPNEFMSGLDYYINASRR